jgi:hypothetical protein
MIQIFEGTWEELKLHDAELAGKRMRVVVSEEIEKISTPEEIEQKLEAWNRFISMGKSGPGIDISREGISGPDNGRG